LAADELARNGTSVRLGRTIHVPKDEMCSFVFDVPSRLGAAVSSGKE
jgi:hypothetical protein